MDFKHGNFMNASKPDSKSEKLKLAVFISGRGSNLQALIDAMRDPAFPAEIVGVVSNRPDALGLQRAFEAGIPAMIVDSTAFKGMPKKVYEQALLETIEPWKPDYVCLAGFMRLLSSYFIEAVSGRIINIHPSLLPKHKGLDTHKAVLAAGESESGCTVHFVVPEMDAGPVLIQKKVPVLAGDTEETLAKRVLEAEHLAYPEAIIALFERKTPMAHPHAAPSPSTVEIERAQRMWEIFSKSALYTAVGIALVLALMGLTLT